WNSTAATNGRRRFSPRRRRSWRRASDDSPPSGDVGGRQRAGHAAMGVSRRSRSAEREGRAVHPSLYRVDAPRARRAGAARPRPCDRAMARLGRGRRPAHRRSGVADDVGQTAQPGRRAHAPRVRLEFLRVAGIARRRRRTVASRRARRRRSVARPLRDPLALGEERAALRAPRLHARRRANGAIQATTVCCTFAYTAFWPFGFEPPETLNEWSPP